MPDYSKSIIYKLINYDYPELVYVGSTTNFTKRKQQHKCNCHNEKGKAYNLKVYINIRENGGWKNWNMIKLCDYSCNDKREAEKEEDKYMMELKANMNTNRAFRTKQDYYKDNNEIIKQKAQVYNENNKDKIKKIKKQYREDNKEMIQEYMKQYYEDNIETLKQHKKKHYEDNKDYYKDKQNQYIKDNRNVIIIKQKQFYDDNKEKINEKIQCECGTTCSRQHKARHEKSNKHINLMKNKV
jgi:hypothetical protein